MGRQSKVHEHRGKYRFRFAGREYGGFARRVDAEKALKRLQRGGPFVAGESDGPPLLTCQLIHRWIDTHLGPPSGPDRWIDFTLRRFDDFVANTPLSQASPDILQSFARHLAAAKLSANTIRQSVAYARRVLRWAAQQGWLNFDALAAKLPKAPRSPDPLPQAQVQAIFAALRNNPKSQTAADVFHFLLATGARPGEACRLTWADVDLDRGVATLAPGRHKTGSKTGQARIIPLPPEALEIVRRQRELSGSTAQLPQDAPVFSSRLDSAYTPAGLRTIFRRAVAKALGPEAHARPYQLRHTCAQLLRDKHPPDVLQRWLGHTSINTTLHYYAVDDVQLRSAAASHETGARHLLVPPPPPAPSAAPAAKAAPPASRRSRSRRRR